MFGLWYRNDVPKVRPLVYKNSPLTKVIKGHNYLGNFRNVLVLSDRFLFRLFAVVVFGAEIRAFDVEKVSIKIRSGSTLPPGRIILVDSGSAMSQRCLRRPGLHHARRCPATVNSSNPNVRMAVLTPDVAWVIRRPGRHRLKRWNTAGFSVRNSCGALLDTGTGRLGSRFSNPTCR